MTIFDQFRRENSNIFIFYLLKIVNFFTKIKIDHFSSCSRICKFWSKNGPLTHCVSSMTVNAMIQHTVRIFEFSCSKFRIFFQLKHYLKTRYRLNKQKLQFCPKTEHFCNLKNILRHQCSLTICSKINMNFL